MTVFERAVRRRGAMFERLGSVVGPKKWLQEKLCAVCKSMDRLAIKGSKAFNNVIAQTQLFEPRKG
jgi:hypothetical protein